MQLIISEVLLSLLLLEYKDTEWRQGDEAAVS